MKNNTLFRNCLLGATALFLSSALVSCDDIASDDRYIEAPLVQPVRTILIEDFTGQDCLNCPKAHTTLEGLEQKYGDNVVGISIHAGSLSLNRKRTNFSLGRIGLGTPEGTYYYDLAGKPNLPFGVINGRSSGEFATWLLKAETELLRPTALNINVTPVADLAANDVKIDVELLPDADMEGNLMVWIVESGITAQQKMPNGIYDEGYVHNNVFRAAVNGQDGESVKLSKGQTRNYSYSIELRDNKEEKWVPENLAVVAFLKKTDGIEQVKKTKVSVR